jgi:hypothetical protein
MIITSKPISLYWAKEPVCTVHPKAEDDRLELMEDWNFEIITKRSVHRLTILAGFRFEGSVPRVFWRIITPTDPAAWAAFLTHDYAYQLCKAKLMKREDADECLFLALKDRYNWFTVRSVYYAVRVGGGSHVKKPLTESEKHELRNIL